MKMSLTSIADRLTPSNPLEITFGAQPSGSGSKKTTLIAHMASSGSTAIPYSIYKVVNVGDPVKAKAEVDAIAGAGSQAGKMAYAFVNANAAPGRSNFPAFQICFLKNSDTGFGLSDEAIAAIKLVRSDMIVNCYPASNSAAQTKMTALANYLSGPDRDLSGQFGSFVTTGSLDVLSTAITYGFNSNKVIVAYLQDTNTALVTDNGVLTSGSNIISAIASTDGINPGASISGTGVPAGAFAGVVTSNSVTMVDSSGNPLNAAANEASEPIAFQNIVSQTEEIIAAAHAGAMMAFIRPYLPLNNVTVGGLIPPKKTSDYIVLDPAGPSEAALVAGLSPLRVQPGNLMGFIRTRTTWLTQQDGVTPITNYFDWQQLVVLNDFREDTFVICQNPPFNNNPGGSKASSGIAALLKDNVLLLASKYEDAGMMQNTKALAKQFIIAPSLTSAGRFDFKIPVDAIPNLNVIAGNIQAVTELTTFTL
jgi:hypothetical protein